ncbi:MAG: hypothetical protein HQ567_03880 [Candidatus Nealsonbacteria bacterium]|nr:hypothetical protein [Candidatus Nealsonbacteria bacterium]
MRRIAIFAVVAALTLVACSSASAGWATIVTTPTPVVGYHWSTGPVYPYHSPYHAPYYYPARSAYYYQAPIVSVPTVVMPPRVIRTPEVVITPRGRVYTRPVRVRVW